jgi:membrane protein DedA with SNARE-associated domain
MQCHELAGRKLVAALVWNTGFCLLWYVAGIQCEQLVHLMEQSGWVLLAVLMALFVG